MHSYILALGPSVIKLTIHPHLETRIENTPWENFVCDLDPTTLIDVEPGPIPATPEGSLIFDAGKGWKLYADQDGNLEYRFNFGHEETKVLLRLDWPPVRGCLYFPPAAAGHFPLQYPVDEILFQTLLADKQAVIVHAAGIVSKKGLGYLFPGVSGAGKSTLARSIMREESGTLLSDDRVALWMENGTPKICGTPWHGDVPVVNASTAELAGIFFIEHGCRVLEFRALTVAEAASQLISRSVPPYWSRRGMSTMLDLAEKVATACPAALYRNIPGADVLKKAEEYIENRKP